ncbi:hypothetical protein PsYK624_086390 [Phanerochaete sordida]|uniref:Uncharacterized protein n=1 Tax=Phanerochaete sordida TaxID=48140 RepID=A0A9P3LEQ0_9APHY|nr:hypothetical protein PsYK624_086390 [Phanerochaete sordida]
MKKFLRGRKNSQTQESKPVVSAPVRLASAPVPTSAPETPLYARFASTSRSEDGHSKPIVAEPKALSSKTSFSRFSIRSLSGQDRQSRVLSRKSSRQEQSLPEARSQGRTLSCLKHRVPPLVEP